MLNSLDLDQVRRFVGPHLAPNCLQSLSADKKVAARKERTIDLKDNKQQVAHFFIVI